MSAIFACLAVLAACSGGDAGDWHTFDDQGWLYGDTLTFENDWSDADSVNINIYHTDAYNYSNLWIEMSYTTKENSVVADTFNIMLADPAGRWLGRGNGLTYNLSAAVHPGHAIAKDTPLRVRHIMRVDSLCDIEKIGLRR